MFFRSIMKALCEGLRGASEKVARQNAYPMARRFRNAGFEVGFMQDFMPDFGGEYFWGCRAPAQPRDRVLEPSGGLAKIGKIQA
jgi:hypothetical protein